MNCLITIDGVEFHWGMTIVNESGDEFVLNEAEYEFQHLHPAIWVVSKKDAPHHYKIMVKHFYSSQAARIEWQVKRLEIFKSLIDRDIEKLKTGFTPTGRIRENKYVQELPYLQESYKINEIWEILTPQNCSWLGKKESKS